MLTSRDDEIVGGLITWKHILIPVIIVINILGVILFFALLNSGELSGVFVKSFSEDYGDFCGDYPHTTVYLENRSVVVFWYTYDSVLNDSDLLEPGERYIFGYHWDTLPSCTSSVNNDIDVKVLDYIKDSDGVVVWERDDGGWLF